MNNRLWNKFVEDKVAMLVYINIAVFLLISVLTFFDITGISESCGRLASALSLPSSDIVITLTTRPWTIITYMFTHYDFIHILFNLIALYWFGRLMSFLIGEYVIVRVYLIGGIAGAVAYFLTPSSLIPTYMSMTGASASVMAIILCVAVSYPKYSVRLVLIGELKLGLIAAVYVLIDIISIPALSNVGGHIAHLGGAVAGTLIALWWKYRGMPSANKTISWPRRNRHLKIVRGGMADADMEWNRQKINRIAEIDRILDKIKASGYESLSEDERKTLLDESKK